MKAIIAIKWNQLPAEVQAKLLTNSGIKKPKKVKKANG